MNIDKDILKRYTKGHLSDEEKAFVEQWYQQYSRTSTVNDVDLDHIVHSLDNKLGIKQDKPKSIFWYMASAVAAALCVFGFIFFQERFSSDEKKDKLIYAPQQANAYVILKDNEEFYLDNLDVDDTLKSKDFYITRLPDGSIKYLHSNNILSSVQYNTLITKNGGTASLTLSDGSKVWINANSKLTYPIVFNDVIREVELEGEGYFEIEKQHIDGKNSPFFVRAKNRTIQVLGTKFNLDYYNKDAEVALIEGHINVAKNGSILEDKNPLYFGISMSPNQLLKGEVLTSDTNIERHIDWKEGFFNLNGVGLGILARELSIWYGVTIKVEESLHNYEIFGRIKRNKSLNEVLDLIKAATPINYKISENSINITRVIN
ncbi:FecR family protein [Sphingobacterium bovistauri]|uniref:FecR family protein n=1 Tax=Sphingobacterium bovistauri TaxID=2781959 RepID=A0ABS7Z978_9SPHI|nr:FecR family protein [Sphingobacterium bovistauri]MCA5006741.1 FecR family protein [Sphingobacterium bovistauri]